MRNPFRPPRPDDAQLGVLARVVNATTTRLFTTLSTFGLSHNGGRDLLKVFGYPTESERSFDYFWNLYRFGGYSARIVAGVPRSCWRDGARFLPDTDSEEELISDELATLRGLGLFRALERADILNRIGAYSVLYVGVPDGKDPREPIEGGGGGRLDDVYFSPYSQPAATVVQYDTDVRSPRYGLPELYTLNPNGVHAAHSGTTVADVRQSITAHWSRVVHLAEGALDNALTGTPYLDPIVHRILDLDKAAGGAAEAYYRNAAQKFTMDIDKEASMSAAEMAALDEASKAWLNDWKTFIGARGAKFRTHPVDMISPRDTVDVALDELSAYTGIPRRILTGEGGGQLKGTEDKASYNQLINDRQDQECTGWFLGALAPIAAAGLLQLPERYVVDWPVPEAMDEETQSKVELNEARAAQARAQAVATYGAAPGAEAVVPPDVFRREVLRVTDAQIGAAAAQMQALGDG